MSNYRALFAVKKMSKNTCTLGPSLDRGPAADIGVLGPESVYMFSGRYCCMPDYPAGRSLNSNCMCVIKGYMYGAVTATSHALFAWEQDHNEWYCTEILLVQFFKFFFWKKVYMSNGLAYMYILAYILTFSKTWSLHVLFFLHELIDMIHVYFKIV